MPRFTEGGPRPPEQNITLEQWLNKEFVPQYRAEADFLRRNRLLEILPKSREMGLLDITGKERKLPSPEELGRELKNHKEAIELKLNQGFTRLAFTPFGSPLAKLELLVQKKLLELHKAGKLVGVNYYDSNGQPQDKPLDLDINHPLYVWDKLDKADETGTLIYFPKQFTSQDYGGQTKIELLENTAIFPGWEVELLESSSFIPRAGKGKTTGGRKQLEAGLAPNEYLSKLKEETEHVDESGQIPEDELTELLRSLMGNGRVIHDFQNNMDSINYHLGAWVPASGGLLIGSWSRLLRQADLSMGGPEVVDEFFGACPAVRINRLGV